MKPLWSALVRRFAALSRRERLVVAALLVIGPPLVALTLWVEPAWRSHLALQAELTASTADSARRANGPQADPNAMAKVELDSLQAQLARDRQAVAALSHSMVAPAEMVQLLERLLARHPGVRLMAMRSLASEPWTAAGPGATPAAGANAQTGGLYRHGVELELEGGWHSLRAYLADIERSPRRLQWGELQLSAQEHPAMRMKISLHTLSLEAAWLQL
jgi:MSHA biogenesis protein MshJ